MLRVRLIPALLLDDESLVKTRRFRKPVYVGDPCNTVRIFNELEVDELAFLDITATPQRRAPNFELLGDIATECFMPLSYGGGLANFEDAARIFETGFEKVIVNSHAHARPELITEIAEVYGAQAVVASIDVGRGLLGGERVMSHGGRTAHAADPVAWAMEMERRGAGEILLTSMDRDGTGRGFDLDLLHGVCSAVRVPVVASGGVGSLQHFVEGARAGATGLLAASVFHFGTFTVSQVKEALHEAGLPVRLPRLVPA